MAAEAGLPVVDIWTMLQARGIMHSEDLTHVGPVCGLCCAKPLLVSHSLSGHGLSTPDPKTARCMGRDSVHDSGRRHRRTCLMISWVASLAACLVNRA